jgi:ferredoxin
MTATEPGARLRAIVDRDECFGFGFCESALPQVFRLDETGHAVALDVDADAELLTRAAEDCPRSAITIVRREPVR